MPLHKTALAMIFKLAEAAQKSWRRLNGRNQLPKLSRAAAGAISAAPPGPARQARPPHRLRRVCGLNVDSRGGHRS
jgi:hypothetical protein